MDLMLTGVNIHGKLTPTKFTPINFLPIRLRPRSTAMLHRLGTFAVRRARLVLLATVLLLVAAGVAGFGAFSKLAGGGFDDPGSESAKAATALADRFGGHADLVFVVDAGRDPDQAAAAGTELTHRIAAEPELTGVSSYWTTKAPGMRTEGGTKALVVASIGGDFDS